MRKAIIKKYSSEEAPESNGSLDRRDFFRILGGGIILFLRPWDAVDVIAAPGEQQRGLPKDYNAFLHIAEDGMITCYTGKIEMGQGIVTSLAVMMAEELNVSPEKVKMVMGDTDLCPYDAGTWGSLTTRSFGPNMRAAAAEARQVLLEMGSEKLGVPADRLEINDGVISESGKPANKVSYSQLSMGKKIEKHLEVKPTAEDYRKYNLVGKSYYRFDGVLKATGKAKYTADLRLPGMVYARILRPPSHGATLKSADLSAVEGKENVQVVRDGDFIALVGENIDTLDRALKEVKAEYTFQEMPVNDKTVFEWMLKADSRANVVRSSGDIEKGVAESDKVFETQFHDSYLAHAPIETHTALAAFEGPKLTVWAATQSPFGLQDALVRELGLTRETVRVITPFVGGGFGGKSAYRQGVEAGRLAKLTGKPVMLIWTRDEEFFYDNFHSAAVIKLKSGVGKDGLIKVWDYHVYYAGTRGAETIYDVPNNRTTDYSRNRNAPPVHPFETGPWRAPNNNTNTFARECQIDIMASAAGIDPLEFRLRNLKDEKMIACLKAVAEKFGYKPAVSPSGRGMGIACGTDAGTWVAHIVEVSVDKMTGKVKVIRIAVAQDMGQCVNREGSLIQMEGCLTMALGYTFTEELKFEGGNIGTRGFDTYEIPRFSWLPKMDCVILDRQDKAPQGGGEPAIIAVGAAVANAIFDATGARLLRMPMTPERVLEALRKV
ncbi:MAG: molybdopterin cofactor-binding domain-containing protein [Bacteroidales bacterium]